MSDVLTVDRVEDRLVLTLNDPDVRNALSVEMSEALQAALAPLDPPEDWPPVEADPEDSRVRCVVLQAAGQTFCAGGDIQAMIEGVATEMPPAERIEVAGEAVNRAVQALYECPLPTVAKVDGAAFGAGAALAIAADVVLASERARIGFGFRQVGLSVDSGTSYLLPRQVGESRALDLVMTGDLLSADRAEELGLFTRVFPEAEFEQRARGVVEQVAAGPTLALARSKELVRSGRDRSLSAAIDAELDALESTLGSADHREGATAFMEHRDPEFEGR